MDFKWLFLNVHLRPDASDPVLKISFLRIMYLPVIISLPIFICLWIYFLILLKNTFLQSSSVQLNIDSKSNNVPNKIFEKVSITNSSSVKEVESFKKRKKIHVPKFMLELYEKNKLGGKDIKRPDVVRSLIPTHAEPLRGNEVLEDPTENHLLIFNIPASDEDEQFVSAELKILTLLDISPSNEIGVQRILKMSIYDDTVKHLLDFQEIQIHHFNNSWVSFDVTAPVNEILQNNSRSKYLKIVITISTFLPQITDNLKLSLMPLEEDYEHDYPVLLLTYSSTKDETNRVKEVVLKNKKETEKLWDDNPLEKNKINNDVNKIEDSYNEETKKLLEANNEIENRVIKLTQMEHDRRKRSIEDDYEEETNKLWDDDLARKSIQVKRLKRLRNTCRKRPLYVDFAEIKYDVWIVQPSGYEAYQCSGRCFYPVAEHLNPTKHAIVQALLHSVAPSKVTRSCCVPTLLDSISILYVDTNGVLTYRYSYRDMVVVECGCR